MAAALAFGESAAVISAYGKDGFTIHNEVYAGPVWVAANAVATWNGKLADSELYASLAQYVEKAELLLVGTGSFHLPLLPTIRREIKQRFGMVVETMDTGAACRTYNILHSEGRQVAALLVPIS